LANNQSSYLALLPPHCLLHLHLLASLQYQRQASVVGGSSAAGCQQDLGDAAQQCGNTPHLRICGRSVTVLFDCWAEWQAHSKMYASRQQHNWYIATGYTPWLLF
jgi:hypothetical protein